MAPFKRAGYASRRGADGQGVKKSRTARDGRSSELGAPHNRMPSPAPHQIAAVPNPGIPDVSGNYPDREPPNVVPTTTESEMPVFYRIGYYQHSAIFARDVGDENCAICKTKLSGKCNSMFRRN